MNDQLVLSLWGGHSGGAVATEESAEESLPERTNSEDIHKKVQRTPDENKFLNPKAHFGYRAEQRRSGRCVGQRVVDSPRSGPRNDEHLPGVQIQVKRIQL